MWVGAYRSADVCWNSISEAFTFSAHRGDVVRAGGWLQ